MLVYDVGMAGGDDTAYYLAKGCRVIAIDANPDICATAAARFSQAIEADRLTILNVGVGLQPGRATFHIHESLSEISSFVPDAFAHKPWAAGSWRGVDSTVERLSDLIRRFGSPDFVKIDVEFFDANVLRDLMSAGIRPPLISVEAQQIDTMCLLVAMDYRRFRLVIGEDVGARFSNASVRVSGGDDIRWAFGPTSSGPFGDDLSDPWLDAETVMRQLLSVGLGWVDVHAAR